MAKKSNEAAAATAVALDFTNVKDGGGIFNKKRQAAGDYRAKVTKVVTVKAKSDNKPQWLFTIQVGSGTYPYYCKLVPEQLWKLRNLLMAAGLNVPKQRLKVDPNKVVGREIAVTLDDAEYDDGEKVKKQSEVTATFPVAELDPDASRDTEDEDDDDEEEDEDDDSDDEEDDDEEEEEPAPKKSKKKSKPAPEPEEDEDEDDDDDDDEDEPEPPKKAKKNKAKKKSKRSDDDDELDELDIDL